VGATGSVGQVNLTAHHGAEEGSSIADVTGASFGPVNNGHSVSVRFTATAVVVTTWSDDENGGRKVDETAIALDHFTSECRNCAETQAGIVHD
jgi:hypothetical protein